MRFFGWYMVIGSIFFIVAKWLEPNIMEKAYDKVPFDKNIIDCIVMIGISVLWLPILFMVIPELIKERRNK